MLVLVVQKGFSVHNSQCQFVVPKGVLAYVENRTDGYKNHDSATSELTTKNHCNQLKTC